MKGYQMQDVRTDFDPKHVMILDKPRASTIGAVLGAVLKYLVIMVTMLVVGFGSSFAGHIGGVFLAGGAPLLALFTGLVVLGAVIVMALWAVRRV